MSTGLQTDKYARAATLSNINVFIPYVFSNIDEEYITKAFKMIGVINHMDFVSKQDREGKLYNAVYIHFDYWLNNTTTTKLHHSLENGDEARLIHDTPWFWVVLPNKGQKFISTDRKPRIDLQHFKKMDMTTNTPEKKTNINEPPPMAPVKATYAQIALNQNDKIKCYPFPCKFITRSDNIPNLEDEYDAEYSEDIANMAEMEAEMDAELKALNPDASLVSIDARYVQTIEHENFYLRNQVNELKQALALLKYLSSQGIY